MTDASQLNLLSMLPEILVALAGVCILLVNALSRGSAEGAHRWISLIAVVAAGWFTLNPLAVGTGFSGTSVVDAISMAGNSVVLLVLLFLLLGGESYLTSRRIPLAEYHSLALFAATGMMALISAADLIVVFMGVEVLSISLYCMAALLNETQGGREAAIKYFLTGSFASGFLLFGMALIFGFTGTTSLPEITTAMHSLDSDNWMLVGGALLMLVGFLFKVSAAPFHSWAPDVYDGSPAIVTAFMSTAAKAAAFTGFARVFVPALGEAADSWVPVIALCAALTMLIGNFSALAQSSFKRMLAFSGVAHAGYMLLGILSAGSDPMHLRSVMFYLLPYALINVVLFLVGAAISTQRSGKNLLDDFKGLATTQPLLAILISVLILALAGIPPTAGFVGKFYLFMGAVETGHVNLAILGILTSVVSVYFYLRVIVFMWFHKNPAGKAEIQNLDGGLMLVTALASAMLLLLGIWPNIWMSVTNAIS